MCVCKEYYRMQNLLKLFQAFQVELNRILQT